MAPSTDKAQTPPRFATKVAQLFPQQGAWTEEDYFSLPETNHYVELSDGKLVIPDMPSDPHQFAVLELASSMRAHSRARDLGRVSMAPLPVRLWPGKIREPDVVFLSRAHDDRRGHDAWGVPDLVVEVISPRTKTSSGTERTDRKEKFGEYARAGVGEYWLVDLRGPEVEVYVLVDGRYQLLGRFKAGEQARSTVLEGFTLAVSALVEA